MKFFSSLNLKLIYVFRINDDAHKGCLKVGETTCESNDIFALLPNCKALNAAARKRINQYTQTAGIDYELLHTELTLYTRQKALCSFNDKEVHSVLMRSGVKKKVFDTKHKANEWFITDLKTVQKAIAAVKEGRESLTSAEVSHEKSPIVFRPEQREAIEKTKKQFRKGNQMLWNAKMRFGKTLSALQVVKDMDFCRTLILTHRPVVDSGWFEDFGKIFYDRSDFAYGSKNNGDSHANLEARAKQGKCQYVYFASMQDLRGSELVGGNFDKNNEIFATNWDCLIVDEAHEGTQTDLGKSVMQELVKNSTKVLRLSGTPFNLLDNFKEDEIYTWDYVMEQHAKAEWDKLHFGDPNPYASLPKMNIYTYNLGKLLHGFEDEDIAFNFREFFRTDDAGNFVHEKDIQAFLNLLTKEDPESYYPFANDEYRNVFRHTLWMLPGVKEARAMSALLQSHPIFQHFKVVNVAGEGDADEESRDALSAVEEAIGIDPDTTRTITLSCGRLTTGVSVKAWTGVLMMAGSYNTAASAYMQTIFRVQTPATINGRVKEQCYVFDFAPDRTLKVIAEAAKISAKAGKTKDSDRKIMGEFLNFCPIISVEGSRMAPFDVPKMLEQLKKVYVERVVRNGFEDSSLYNDRLLKLDSLELEKFDNLSKIIGKTKAMPKTGQVDINNQGLTDEQYEELQELEKKKKHKDKDKPSLTEEEQKRLEELKDKKKNRDIAISVLRGISIRMPLLIFGAELKDEKKSITIDSFADLIDEQSWNEFMPQGVTTAMFNDFKMYYDPDIFQAAGKRIRDMAKAADKLCVEERIQHIAHIFGTFRNPDKETVLTPWRIVNMHIGDCIGGYNFYDEGYNEPLNKPRLIDRGHVTQNTFNVESRILELNSKSGLYPLYMTYSLYRARVNALSKPPSSIEEEYAIWDKVVRENVFVICNTTMAKSITKRSLVGFRNAKVNVRYFENLVNQLQHKPQNFVNKIPRGMNYWKSTDNDNMKFNAIVGNPPYQVMDGGTDRGAVPVYHHFVNIAKKLSPNYISLIMPARWYAGGRGLESFRTEMMQDRRLEKLFDYELSKDIFPTVDIAGGLCTFLWNKNHNGKCTVNNHAAIRSVSDSRYLDQFSILIRSNAAIPLIEKIAKKHEASTPNPIYLNSLVLSINPFGFRTYYRGQNQGELRILTSKGWAYVNRAEVSKGQEYIDQYKIIVGRFVPSNGEMSVRPGDGYRVFTEPQILQPGEINTETYIDTAVFPTKVEAENYKKYLLSKFARYLLRQGITSVNVTRECFTFVPMQDFTSTSDIDWNESLQNIDKQLYHKYELTKEESDFIEKMIKYI